MWPSGLSIIFSLVLFFAPSPLKAADIEGSRDHPMISRYQGAKIINYTSKEFDEYHLFVSKATQYGGKDKNLNATKALEGKIVQITYQAPAQRSTLEVFKNYEQSLNAEGFAALFRCKNDTCGGRNFNHAVAAYHYFGEDHEDQRFLAAQLVRPEGDVFVSLYVAMHKGGENAVRVQLDVIELQAMQEKMVVVDADAMAKGISEQGHIALYTVFFATDSADLVPDATPALDQIAQLLRQTPQLKLMVVGHTDNHGKLDYNKDLSRRRAAAVVTALVSRYNIQQHRLSADGVAWLAPVASNRDAQGRAKNRRVELVEMRE